MTLRKFIEELKEIDEQYPDSDIGVKDPTAIIVLTNDKDNNCLFINFEHRKK